MSTNTEYLQNLHAELWRWRDRMRPTWPTPPRDDALMFAATELCECFNVLLNAKGIYKRNNNRDKDLYQELAQCAMMLFTALGPAADCRQHLTTVEPDVVAINLEIASALASNQLERPDHPIDVLTTNSMLLGALAAIARYPGMDLERQLALALGALEAKWGPHAQ